MEGLSLEQEERMLISLSLDVIVLSAIYSISGLQPAVQIDPYSSSMHTCKELSRVCFSHVCAVGVQQAGILYLVAGT